MKTAPLRSLTLPLALACLGGCLQFSPDGHYACSPGQTCEGENDPPLTGAEGALRRFSTVSIEEFNTLKVPSDGDLWPSCWSDDGALYAANGNGYGFDPTGKLVSDTVVNRIRGSPLSGLSGEALAAGEGVGTVWRPGNSRKPTGMLCSRGKLYLAVQDRTADNDETPASTIAVSEDHGLSFTWDKAAPMFDNGVFTTVFFLDYGKDSANAKDGFVYAYGLDGNWRDSFSQRVGDPNALYLARVANDRVLEKGAWAWFAGLDATGAPRWSPDLLARKPVLEDSRRVSSAPLDPAATPRDMTVLSQGSVVYNKPLDLYLYSSWTAFTFELYQSPTPWGPWTHFFSKDFGRLPWFADKYGGYATTLPSKFISADGKTLYLVSSARGAGDTGFSMRKLVLEPFRESAPTNARSPDSLTQPSSGATPIARALHYGRVALLNNGVALDESEDSWNGEVNTEDYWGYTFTAAQNLNAVVYTTGAVFPDGGWFKSLRVEVRRNQLWVPVSALVSEPAYPLDPTASGNKTFTFTFADTWGDGVRIVGAPGGASTFTTVAELKAFYR